MKVLSLTVSPVANRSFARCLGGSKAQSPSPSERESFSPSLATWKDRSPATSAMPATQRSAQTCHGQRGHSIRRKRSDDPLHTALPVNRSENSWAAVPSIEQRYFWLPLRPHEWQTARLEGIACRFYYR